MKKPHKFDIGEGFGIWEADGETHRSFPDVFYRAKPGDSAGKFTIGDDVVLRQPSSKSQFGMFLIANVETGDFGGTGLKYKITVHPVGTPDFLGAGNDRSKTLKTDAEDGNRTRVRTSYTMQRIRLADCKPHADAEAYSCSTEDRAALANSVAEAGVLSPIAVIPAEGEDPRYEAKAEGRDEARPSQSDEARPSRHQWCVIDGIGRMNALIEAGVEETDAQVFDLGPMSVAEFVVSKNSMMRKVTTGTRVMAYLKCHEREVLAAAKEENIRSRMGSKWRNGWKAAVSRETAASDKGWNAKEIAERIGVSKNDVLAGIELLKATAEAGEDGEDDSKRTTARYEQGDLFETMDAVLRGETPIRRWKAAACGKVSKVGGKAAADYVGIGARTMASLIGLFENWQTVPMESRGHIVECFRLALDSAPEDFRTVIEDWARHQAGLDSKRTTARKR